MKPVIREGFLETQSGIPNYSYAEQSKKTVQLSYLIYLSHPPKYLHRALS